MADWKPRAKSRRVRRFGTHQQFDLETARLRKQRDNTSQKVQNDADDVANDEEKWGFALEGGVALVEWILRGYHSSYRKPLNHQRIYLCNGNNKMKRKRTRLLMLLAAGVAFGLVLLIFNLPPQVRLEISKRTSQEGKPVVYFKITGTAKGMMQIENIWLVHGSKFESVLRGTNGLYGCPAAFAFGPEEIVEPLDDKNPRDEPEFGMIEPENEVWRLKTELIMEDRSPFKRLLITLGAWKSIGKGNLLSVLRDQKNVHALKTIYIDSKPVTNAVHREVSSKM